VTAEHVRLTRAALEWADGEEFDSPEAKGRAMQQWVKERMP